MLVYSTTVTAVGELVAEYRDWAEIAADDEARYQASRGFTGLVS